MENNTPEKINPEAQPETAELHVPPRRPRRVNAGMFGPIEFVVMAAGTFAAVGAILLYALVVLPSNRSVVKNKSESERLEAEYTSANNNYGSITTTEAQVSKLVSSVDDFESRFLPVASIGQPALYQKINSLIISNGLTNTTGPDFSPLDAAEQNSSHQEQESDDQKGRAKFRSLYPGVYVTTTVEGTYQNLRRFMREIETGNEFIVISAVELAPSDSEGHKDKQEPAANTAVIPAPTPVYGKPSSPNDRPTTMSPNYSNPGYPNMGRNQQVINQKPPPKGKTHGEVVSLHIEMAAYFRRPNMSPISTR